MSTPVVDIQPHAEAPAPVQAPAAPAPAAPALAPVAPAAPPEAVSVAADGIARSVIRTVVPVIVGVLVAAAVKAGYHVDPNGPVLAETTTVVTGGYYAGVRWLEVHVNPKFGWLLGAAGAPKYAAKA